MRKIFYFAAISAGLLLSSCSMNKDANNSAYLQSGKLQAKQQLAIQNPNPQHLASAVPIPKVNQPVANGNAITPDYTLAKVNVPVVQKQSKTFARNNFFKRTGQKLAKTISIPKTAGTIARLMEKHSPAASFNRIGHTTDMNYLWLWIIAIVAAILFYILAAAALLSLNFGLATVFYVLGFLASIAALVFFILWIVQLARG